MISKEEQRFSGMQMNGIALNQNVLCLNMRIGHGFEGKDKGDLPFRVIDNVPVFHIRCNEFDREIESMDSRTMAKFGEFKHPALMVGMPSVSGIIKVYVDFRFDDIYVLLVSGKLNELDMGPSYPAWEVATWTPKMKGDTKMKAGARMFHALILAMDYVGAEEWTVSYYGEDWENEWLPSERCAEVMRKVRGFGNKSY
jgi:hypothetical protein